MINKVEINNIVDVIVQGYNPDKIILFGSYAQEIANENSDLDFVIIKNSETDRTRNSYQIRKLLRSAKINYPMDILIMTNAELLLDKNHKYTLGYEINKTGKIVYE